MPNRLISRYFKATGDLWDYQRIAEITTDIAGMFLETFTDSSYLPQTRAGRQLFLQHKLQGKELPPPLQALYLLDVITNSHIPRSRQVLIRRYGVGLEFEDTGDLIDEKGKRFPLTGCSYDDKGVWNSDGKRYHEPLNVKNEPTISLKTRPHRSTPATILEITENKLKTLASKLREIDGTKVDTINYPRPIAETIGSLSSYVINFDRKFWIGRGEVQVELYYEDYEKFRREIDELEKDSNLN